MSHSTLYKNVTKVINDFFKCEPGDAESLFLGMYPPAKAESRKPHDNRTCTGITREYGDFHFNFCDIFPYSLNKKSGGLDQDFMFKELKKNTDLVSD